MNKYGIGVDDDIRGYSADPAPNLADAQALAGIVGKGKPGGPHHELRFAWRFKPNGAGLAVDVRRKLHMQAAMLGPGTVVHELDGGYSSFNRLDCTNRRNA